MQETIHFLIVVALMAVSAAVGACGDKTSTINSPVIDKCTRDIQYEDYCDSIWNNNPEYYYDVLVESDEYQEYLETHGQWWND